MESATNNIASKTQVAGKAVAKAATIGQGVATEAVNGITKAASHDVRLDFLTFVKFLKDHNVITMAIVAVLSDRINDLTNTFVDSIILPVIYRDADNNGVQDIEVLEKKTMKVAGAKIGVGKMIVSIIRFVVITYVVFVMCNKYCANTEFLVVS